MLRAVHPKLLYQHSCMLLQLGALCRKPSINADSYAAVSSVTTPVLLLAEGLGNKPVVSPPAQGCQRGPPHTPKAGDLLPAVLPGSLELGVHPVPAPKAQLQPRGWVMSRAAGRDPCVAHVAAQQHMAHPASEDHVTSEAGRGIRRTCWVVQC